MQKGGGNTVLLTLDFSGRTPIYRQIRDQVVQEIARGNLKPGDKLPTIRTLAEEAGINMMTASKAYQLLKQEGYLLTDRRSGAVVAGGTRDGLSREGEERLALLASEARLGGMSREEFLALCARLYDDREG